MTSKITIKYFVCLKSGLLTCYVFYLISFILFVLVWSCSSDTNDVSTKEAKELHYNLQISAIQNITMNSAIVTISGFSLGDTIFSEKGLLINTALDELERRNSLQTVEINQISLSDTTISYLIKGLAKGREYYVCAYGIFGGRVSLGSYRSFSTERFQCEGFIDMGQTTIEWHVCNVGAKYPEQTGYYVSWGELNEKEMYNMYWYSGCDHFGNYSFGGEISGTDKDVATYVMGIPCRMPNKEEFRFLLEHCSWNKTSYKGVNGYVVTAPNGNELFFPGSGYKNSSSNRILNPNDVYIWSSTGAESYTNLSCAWAMHNGTMVQEGKLYGLNVRAVRAKNIDNPIDDNPYFY